MEFSEGDEYSCPLTVHSHNDGQFACVSCMCHVLCSVQYTICYFKPTSSLLDPLVSVLIT